MHLPLKITRFKESFIVRDDRGISICAVYFDDDPKRAIVTKRMSQEEAEAVVKHIARALTAAKEGGEEVRGSNGQA